jgi:PAS domain-containing protein
MRTRLRSSLSLAVILTAGGAACAALALALYAVVATLVHAAVPDAAVPIVPFLVLAGVLIAVTVVVWLVVRLREKKHEEKFKSLALKLAKNPASEAPQGPKGAETYIYALAERLVSMQAARDDARLLGQMLLQTGTEYTLLCTPDGRIVDANAALLARAGLTAAQMRSSPTYVLEGILHLGPLLALARRSKEEDTMVTGIPHNLVIDGEVRPVEVSVRMVPLRSGEVVVISMNDKAQEFQLERQIDQYSDAIELMVDQRVARIAAARESVEEIFSRAGTALFMFDRSGNTEKMNGAAEVLTGRTPFTLQRFSDIAAAMLPREEDAQRLANWFFNAQGGTLARAIVTPAGPQQVLLLNGVELHGTAVVRRLFAAVPLPQEAGPEGEAASQSSLRRLDDLAASLDAEEFAPEVRAYLEVIREAVKRLDRGRVIGGDGAVGNAAPITR